MTKQYNHCMPGQFKEANGGLVTMSPLMGFWEMVWCLWYKTGTWKVQTTAAMTFNTFLAPQSLFIWLLYE